MDTSGYILDHKNIVGPSQSFHFSGLLSEQVKPPPQIDCVMSQSMNGGHDAGTQHTCSRWCGWWRGRPRCHRRTRRAASSLVQPLVPTVVRFGQIWKKRRERTCSEYTLDNMYLGRYHSNKNITLQIKITGICTSSQDNDTYKERYQLSEV